jgi:hypothetical protein
MIPSNQIQHPEVQIALSEIRTFAGQMQAMTALFARGQADMAHQLETTTLRLNKAVESVAMGEARIAAQIASFERMTNDSRRATEDHARILSATAGFSHTLETAVGVVDASARKIMEQQADIMASRIAEAMQGGEARLASVSEALDHAAGALAHRIWTTAEAQDTKTRSFEQLVAKCEQLVAAIPQPETVAARFAQDQETSLHLADASKAVNVAALKIIGAVDEMQAAKTDFATAHREGAENMGALAGQQSEIVNALGGLAGVVDKLVVRTVEDHNESVTEMLGRMDHLRNAVDSLVAKGEAAPAPVEAPSTAPALDIEREAMKRLTVGYRLMMRDIGKENERLEQLVGTLGASIQTLNEKAVAAPVPIIVSAPSVPDTNTAELPLLDAEKNSLQRLTVGFRLLLNDISSEAGRLRETVDGVTALTARWPQQLALGQRNSTPDPRIEQHFISLREALARLDGKFEELKPTEIEQAVEAVERNAAALPLFDSEKTSFQHVLTGFRLLLRDIGAQTEDYRDKIGAIRQPELLVLSPTIEADLLAPLHHTAERIAVGVAETISALEHKLAEPVTSLTNAVADGARMLTAAHSVMAAMSEKSLAAPAAMAGQTTPDNARTGHVVTGDALAEAVASMDRAAAGIDQKIGSIDQLLAVLRKGGAVGSEQLRGIVQDMGEAAAALRAEAGDFLAIGAALSRDIEGVITRSDTPVQGRRHKSALSVKKRAA